jgi:hypothetical protein
LAPAEDPHYAFDVILSAIAQAVRAALVKNVDERARNPYNLIVTPARLSR